VTLAGFESLVVTTGTADSGISLANATGLTSVVVNGTHNYAITGLAAGVAVGVGNAATALTDGKGVSVALASATGAADALTFNLTNTGGVTGTTLTANGIETLTLNQSTTVAATAMGLLIRDTNTTNAVNINMTGGIAAAIGGVQDVTFLSTGLESNVATINAGTFAGNMIMASGSRTGTSAMTITGGTGIDTIIMKHANDVLDAGTVTATVDTLNIIQNAVLGGFLIDLSSTTDQVTTYNGAANAAVQKGFDNADLSGVTGNFGADITARALGSIITGTANADVINGGAGNDTFIVNTGTVANSDVMTGGAGTTDTLQIATGLTYTQATDASLATVEVITLVGTAAVVLTGQTEAFTINGGAAANVVIGGDGVDTFVDDAADNDDTFTGGLSSDAFTSGNAADTDTIVTTTGVAYTSLTSDVITTFSVGTGKDILHIDISDSTAIGAGKALKAGGDIDTAIDGKLVLLAIAKDAATTIAATDEAVVITGTFTNAAALLTSIGTTGVLTKNDTEAASIVVVWNDGTNTYVSAVHDAGTDATMTTADLTLVNMATLVGVLTAFHTDNLVAVA
jgi:hypothetical protein